MAKKLEVDDEERIRYVETVGLYVKSITVVPPDCVRFDLKPSDDIRLHLGATQRAFVHQMHSYLINGGKLSRVDENCSDRRRDWEFHFDLWPEFGGQHLFVETRFFDAASLDDRYVHVVSVHPPDRSHWV